MDLATNELAEVEIIDFNFAENDINEINQEKFFEEFIQKYQKLNWYQFTVLVQVAFK